MVVEFQLLRLWVVALDGVQVILTPGEATCEVRESLAVLLHGVTYPMSTQSGQYLISICALEKRS